MKVEATTVQKEETHVFNMHAAQYMCHLVNNREVLQFIELVGPTTAIRAAWANIVKGRDGDFPERTGVKIQVSGKWKDIYVVPGTKYIQYSKKQRLLIYHINFTQERRKSILGGDLQTPPIHFIEALTKNFPHIPFLRNWEVQLWKKMIDAQRIKPLYSYGSMMGWQIDPVARYNEMSIEDAVKELVVSGTISSTS